MDGQTGVQMPAPAQQLLDRIPDEQEVRARLAENLREAAVLRSLLRVAQKKSDAESRNQQGKRERTADA